MATVTTELPRSYMKASERAGFLQDRDALYCAESQAADDAGDEETAWAWLRLTRIPAAALLALKRIEGADYIRQQGLKTEEAESKYGKDWLERDI